MEMAKRVLIKHADSLEHRIQETKMSITHWEEVLNNQKQELEACERELVEVQKAISKLGS